MVWLYHIIKAGFVTTLDNTLIHRDFYRVILMCVSFAEPFMTMISHTKAILYVHRNIILVCQLYEYSNTRLVYGLHIDVISQRWDGTGNWNAPRAIMHSHYRWPVDLKYD